MTKILALLTADLVETPIAHLNATDYAIGLQQYLQSVIDRASSSPNPEISSLTFSTISSAIESLHKSATHFDHQAAELARNIQDEVPWWKWWKKFQLFVEVMKVNRKYKYFERHFLHAKGLDGRNWFKHVVFAPGLHTGYSGVTFPVGLLLQQMNKGKMLM